MDTFPMLRMSFTGTEMVQDPPMSEQTGRVVRDPKDPEFEQVSNVSLPLTGGIEEWWS